MWTRFKATSIAYACFAIWAIFSTRPYTSYFALQMFSRNTPWNMKHSLYTIRISSEFRVLLMPRKNKPQNSSSFRTNADPGAKCKSGKRGVKSEKSCSQYPVTHFRFFTFHTHFRIFHDKCLADISEVISSTSSWENPFMFRKVITSIAKQYEKTRNTRNLSCEKKTTKDNEKLLHTLRILFIFILRTCFMAFLRVVCSQLNDLDF